MSGIDTGTAEPRLVVQTSPYVHQGLTTPALMRDVLIALAPVVIAAGWYFGVSGLLVVAAATAGAMVTEGCGPGAWKTLGDWSAALTGVLLGLTLPPGLPLWMAFLGGVVAIGLGKLIWGGLGHNLFNPALVGRAFLQAAFPTALTTWPAPAGPPGRCRGATFALPVPAGRQVDAVTTATPLGLMKFETADRRRSDAAARQHRRLARRDQRRADPARRALARLRAAPSTGASRSASCSRSRRSPAILHLPTPSATRRRSFMLLSGRPALRRGVHGHRSGDDRRSRPAAPGSSASASACWWC